MYCFIYKLRIKTNLKKFAKLSTKYSRILQNTVIRVCLKFKYYRIIGFFFYFFSKKIISKHKPKDKTNILVFYKSHGISDLEDNEIKENFNLYILSRSLLKVLFLSIFNEDEYKFLFRQYNSNDKNLNLKKEKYLKILDSVFQTYFKILNIKIIISFNLLYSAEREMHRLSKKFGIKYLVMQKESLFNKQEIKIYKNILYKNHEKYEGHLITSYNKQYKDCLIKSNIVKKNQIKVIGMPRADKFFKIKKEKEFNKYFLVPLINTKAGFYNLTEKKKLYKISQKNLNKWMKNPIKTLEQIYLFSKKNTDAKFIFKTKVPYENQTLKQQKFIYDNMLPNWQLVQGGSVSHLLNKCSNVIGLNTTILVEALILNKNIIVPVLDINKQTKNNHTIKLDKVTNVAKNKFELNFLLNKCLNQNAIKKRKAKDIKKVLDMYIGNSDGKSSKRLLKLLKKIS